MINIFIKYIDYFDVFLHILDRIVNKITFSYYHFDFKLKFSLWLAKKILNKYKKEK